MRITFIARTKARLYKQYKYMQQDQSNASLFRNNVRAGDGDWRADGYEIAPLRDVPRAVARTRQRKVRVDSSDARMIDAAEDGSILCWCGGVPPL